MIHLKIADKTFLVGDETAGLIVEYAALLGRIGSADTVQFEAIGADGDVVKANLLLNSGTSMVAESTHSELPTPDNSATDEYLRERLASYGDPSALDLQANDPFSERA